MRKEINRLGLIAFDPCHSFLGRCTHLRPSPLNMSSHQLGRRRVSTGDDAAVGVTERVQLRG